MFAGFKVWAERFDEDVRPRYPGIRYYLLHSLSHLLITAISLECGYAASSIRERIYCAPTNDPLVPMAAILLSTGSPGTEGTLGGLVEQGMLGGVAVGAVAGAYRVVGAEDAEVPPPRRRLPRLPVHRRVLVRAL